MNSAYAGRYRRRSGTTREASSVKKDSLQEQPFFAVGGSSSFFKPLSVVAKKCNHCEGDDGTKLISHEPLQVMQNDPGTSLRRKVQPDVEEKDITLSIDGTGGLSKNKSAKGGCNIPSVSGRTDFAPKPSTYSVKNAKTKSSNTCEACTAPECIVSSGTIVSKFSSDISVTLPPVPDGLTKCESAAVKKFIKTTLSNHEQDHVKAFKKYNGTVKTPYTFSGCKTDFADYIRDIHNGIDTQRADDAIAESDALDPFVKPIPCNCKEE